jgi:transcriptional regulator with XRE-family HTH domain
MKQNRQFAPPKNLCIPEIFGNNVRKYRKNSGYTQEQLAEKLEITQKHLSIIETGIQFVSASLLGKIVSVLQVQPAALFEYEVPDVKNDMYDAICSYIDTRLDEYYRRIKKDITDLQK